MSINEHPPQVDSLPDISSAGYNLHVPVLLDATLRLVNPQKNESYLDLTAGYGGHASEFLSSTENYADSVLVDRDENAINTLGDFEKKGVRLIHTDFVNATKQLIEEGREFDIILVDLGVSSPQLDKSERGFSFTHSGPLDMRMDNRQEKSAADIVNRMPAKELERIIIRYGEEKPGFAKRIVKAIVAARPIKTTSELSNVILGVHRGKWQKSHPATRTFQAIRIAVNDELKQVEDILPLLPKLLKTGGRVAIISFHSLEDRLVKNYLKDQQVSGYESELQIINKKAISGTEDVHNPRARSAKLRVAVKK